MILLSINNSFFIVSILTVLITLQGGAFVFGKVGPSGLLFWVPIFRGFLNGGLLSRGLMSGFRCPLSHSHCAFISLCLPNARKRPVQCLVTTVVSVGLKYLTPDRLTRVYDTIRHVVSKNFSTRFFSGAFYG